MKEFNYDNLAYNLPDAFAKKENSNNYKFLQTDKHISNGIKSSLENIFNILDLDNATGHALDVYGARLQVERGAMNDEQYLIMIKAQIAKNMSDGTRPFIIEVLAFILNCPESEIDETLQIRSDNKSGDVIVDRMPFTWLQDAGFTREQMIALIESLLPCSVSIKRAMFTGTFEFSENENESDNFKGFANDDNTIGGYLGIDDYYDVEV